MREIWKNCQKLVCLLFYNAFKADRKGFDGSKERLELTRDNAKNAPTTVSPYHYGLSDEILQGKIKE